MKAFGVIVAGFAAFALLFVLLDESLSAQDTKDAKDEKKTEEKKVEKKVRLPDASDVMRAKTKKGKIKDVKTEDPAEITVVLADPSKITEYSEWLLKHRKDIQAMKDPKAKLEKVKSFEADKTAEYNKVMYTGEEVLVPITEIVRIRTKLLPKVYDDAGKEKKLSSTETTKLKTPGLPDYKSDVANLKLGQIVELYLKPTAPAPKTLAPMPVAKKGPIGADPKDTGPITATKTDVYMIHILQEP
jgi:hypothetical protein